MKAIFISIISLICLCCVGQEIIFEPNLIGWGRARAGKIEIEAGATAQDNILRLEAKGQINRTLELEPDTKYEVHFFVKAENLTTDNNSSAGILINAGKKWERITTQKRNLPEVGTFDWKKGVGIIDTGKLKNTRINIYFRGSSSGVIWFKSVKIVKKSALNNAVVIGPVKFDRYLQGWNLQGKKNIDVDIKTKVKDCSVICRDDSGVTKEILLEPNSQYEISFYIKGENIQGNQGAGVLINAGKKWQRITSKPNNAFESGTFDWKKCVGVIDTEKLGTNKITIYCLIRGTGTVWFDGLEIKKVTDIQKKNNSWNIKLFPANFLGGKASFCENLPGFLEIISSGKINRNTKTAKMYIDVPSYLTLHGVCENFSIVRNGKPTRVPSELKCTKITRDGSAYSHYEVTFNQFFLNFFGANWYRHVIFFEAQKGSSGKESNIYWSFALDNEKQPEQSVSVKIIDPVKFPEKQCSRFNLWTSSLLAVKSPFSDLGSKSMAFWNSLAKNRYYTARRYNDLYIKYPGYIPMVTANGTNFLSNQDFDPNLSLDFYNSMPKDITNKGKVNPKRSSSVWALVDDRDGIYDKYLRTTLRNLKKIYPDMKHIWWDFEPFVYGYDEAGRARFAQKIGLDYVPTIEDIQKKHSEEYFQYMVKLHAELIAKNVKIIREELPNVKIWFCSDNLHAEAPHVARWCGIDVSLSDAIIDYHMHMPYYTGSRFFDDTAYNIKNLKKPYFPLIDPAERIQSFFKQYSADKVKQNIVATAALGGIGIGFYPDDLLPGEYYHAIADGYSKVANAEEFYFNGIRCDKEISINVKNAISRTLANGKVITFPDFSKTIRYTAHKKDEKYLITVFNYDPKKTMIAEISGRNFKPTLVKVPPYGCEIIGTDIIPEQTTLQKEIAVFSGDDDVFKDFNQKNLRASWTTDIDGRPLLHLSNGTITAGIDALGNNEIVSMLNSGNSELLTDGVAGEIKFEDKLQPPLQFKYVTHGISADGIPFVISEAEVAPYEGANPDPNPLYLLRIKRKIEIKNNSVVISHEFSNPTAKNMPLNCRLRNYPWPGHRFQADKMQLTVKSNHDNSNSLWIRKPNWNNTPFELIGSNNDLQEKICFIPDEKFSGLYTWSLNGNVPRKTVEFLIETNLLAGKKLTYTYSVKF